MKYRSSLCLLPVLAAGLAAGVGCDDGDSDSLNRRNPSSESPPSPPPSAEEVTSSNALRLTQREYDNVVRDLLGDTTKPSASRLPADARTPFDNEYAGQEASGALVEGAELLASEVSERLLANVPARDKVVGCQPTGPTDAACFKSFVQNFGRRILRGPVAAEDVDDFAATAQAVAVEQNDFYAGVDVVLRAFLQHPRFLYKLEIGEDVADRPDVKRLTDWEVASKLSFTLWGTTPDDHLLDIAGANQLRTVDQVRDLTKQMLADPRAEELVTSFHAMWFAYEKLGWDPTLAPAMRQETDALFKRVIFEQKRPWQDVLTANETFVGDALAKHYGLPTHGSDQPAWTSYGSTSRSGLFGQGAFLALGARGDQSSPTLRGKAVRNLLLCQTIAPPPPGTRNDEPPAGTTANACKKDRYKQHAQGGCAGCHDLMDPIGFGLENYDGHGTFQTTDLGRTDCPIDGAGSVPGVGDFRGPSELAQLLTKSPELKACVITQAYRFMSGRVQFDDADKRAVDGLVASRDGTFHYDDLLVDLVGASRFLYRRQ